MSSAKDVIVPNKMPFEDPVVEVIDIPYEDIAACSDDRPGHGWGDENHRHKHWKDQESEDDE